MTKIHKSRARETSEVLKELDGYFDSMVDIPRMKVGGKQSIKSLINEEALLLAKYLGNEKKLGIQDWQVKRDLFVACAHKL